MFQLCTSSSLVPFPTMPESPLVSHGKASTCKQTFENRRHGSLTPVVSRSSERRSPAAASKKVAISVADMQKRQRGKDAVPEWHHQASPHAGFVLRRPSAGESAAHAASKISGRVGPACDFGCLLRLRGLLSVFYGGILHDEWPIRHLVCWNSLGSTRGG